jgi:UDP-glucuronate 4-epimerase
MTSPRAWCGRWIASGPLSAPGTSTIRIQSPAARYWVYNVGNNRPVDLHECIETLEWYLRKLAEKSLLPLQPGDVRIRLRM